MAEAIIEQRYGTVKVMRSTTASGVVCPQIQQQLGNPKKCTMHIVNGKTSDKIQRLQTGQPGWSFNSINLLQLRYM